MMIGNLGITECCLWKCQWYRGVSNGRCGQCVYFCEHEHWSISSCDRAASTLEITNGEKRALRKFSPNWILSLLKRCFAPSNLADIFKTLRTTRAKLGNMIRPYLSSTIPSLVAYSQLCLNGIWSFLRPCLQASRFPLKRVNDSPSL